MKKVVFILGIIAVAMMTSCNNSNNNSNDSKKDIVNATKGIYEPKTKEEFVSILSELNIKPFPGSVITNFSNNANSVLEYKVPSQGISNKDIIDYYFKAVTKAFKNREGWHKYMKTSVSIIYMKGFDLTFSFACTSENSAMEIAGDTTNVPDRLSFTISLGDGATNY